MLEEDLIMMLVNSLKYKRMYSNRIPLTFTFVSSHSTHIKTILHQWETYIII